jgi:uncharacterized protein YxeA
MKLTLTILITVIIMIVGAFVFMNTSNAPDQYLPDSTTPAAVIRTSPTALPQPAQSNAQLRDEIDSEIMKLNSDITTGNKTIISDSDLTSF